MKLQGFWVITGVIHCETGLKIGGTKDTIDIGGVDSPVIRHPLTHVPYIPGSSLKGKMRSLLESVHSNNTSDRGACSCGKCKVCTYFGSLSSTSPTRVLVRDARMHEESKAQLEMANADWGMNFVEVKSENTINRQTGGTTRGGLRTFERVPEGTKFRFEITIRVFADDNQEEGITLIDQAIRLLENDYLGASGGRGYGKVKFSEVEKTFVEA